MARRQLSKRERFAILMRDGFRCVYCGAHGPGVRLQVDHVRSVAGGGDNHQGNLATACDDCNNGKGAMSLHAAPGTEAAELQHLLSEMVARSGIGEPHRVALGLLAGFFNASYSLGREMEDRVLPQFDAEVWEAGAIAAMLPDDPVELARVGLAVCLLLKRTDPAAGVLMQRWTQRIEAEKE